MLATTFHLYVVLVTFKGILPIAVGLLMLTLPTLKITATIDNGDVGKEFDIDEYEYFPTR